MAENKYLLFLKKLIDDTKSRAIEWKYLDTNKTHYETMKWVKTTTEYSILAGNKEKTILDFNEDDSFVTKQGDTFIVIYVWGNHPAKLYVIPYTYKKVIVLLPDEYGEYITRLLNLVQSQFPSADAFIDEFISESTKNFHTTKSNN